MGLQKVYDKDQSRLPIVAIDGPAGAGKSTAARLLAFQFGFILVDTGALYRSLALMAMERGVSLTDGQRLATLCRSLDFQFSRLERPSGEPDSIPKLRIYCNGIEVTDNIRTAEMGMAASNVSKLPEVRDALLDVQRKFGEAGGIVMEGRDIGTVIFPKAEMKFYLTATVESRARRRFEELQQAGSSIALEQVIRETASRDDQDMNRPIAPLKQAKDAILIDSTSRGLDEVVAEMAGHIRQYLKNSP